MPVVDINLPSLFGMALGTFSGSSGQLDALDGDWENFRMAAMFASLAAPVYISFPVQDTQVVDQFLSSVDGAVAVMARKEGQGVRLDYYRFSLPGVPLGGRAFGVGLGPIKWRFFWARVGKGFYIASKPFILRDLAVLHAEAGRGSKKTVTRDRGPTGHALVRLRPNNWKHLLAEKRLSWAENNREACLKNLGPIEHVGRAFALEDRKGANASWDERGRKAQGQAERINGVRFYCPEGGHYLLSPDGKKCQCSVHGTALRPKQPTRPSEHSKLGRLVNDFSDLKATLTFLKDGLHAVVTIERKPE
jgi:hypothetical protein